MKKGITFTDAKGREWHPKVNGRVVRDYEKLAGIGLFGSIFELFEGMDMKADAPNPEASQDRILAMARKLFGNVGHLGFLLYESCRTTRGEVSTVVDQFKVEVSEDEFMEALTGEVMEQAFVVAIEALMEFMPSFDDMQKGAKEGERPPSGPGPGKTSSSSGPSQE